MNVQCILVRKGTGLTVPSDSRFDKKHTHRAPFNLLLALHSV